MVGDKYFTYNGVQNKITGSYSAQMYFIEFPSVGDEGLLPSLSFPFLLMAVAKRTFMFVVLGTEPFLVIVTGFQQQKPAL